MLNFVNYFKFNTHTKNEILVLWFDFVFAWAVLPLSVTGNQSRQLIAPLTCPDCVHTCKQLISCIFIYLFFVEIPFSPLRYRIPIYLNKSPLSSLVYSHWKSRFPQISPLFLNSNKTILSKQDKENDKNP